MSYVLHTPNMYFYTWTIVWRLTPAIVYNLQIKLLYHRERILETSTLSCNEEEEDITKPPKR